MLRILLLLSCLTAVAYTEFIDDDRGDVITHMPDTLWAGLPQTREEKPNIVSGSRWIGGLLEKHGMSLKLKDLTLPGTHHSGLVESMSPKEIYGAAIVASLNLGLGSGMVANSIIRSSGITQTLTPTQQFESGVRKFDLRLSSEGDELTLAHGDGSKWLGIHPTVNGVRWKDFLQASVTFLKSNPSEFFIFGISWTNGDEKFKELADTLKHPCIQSASMLYIHSGSINDIMSTPVCNLQGKILIRTQEATTLHNKLLAAGVPSHFPNHVWIGSYHDKKFPTATSDPTLIFEILAMFTVRVAKSQKKLYAVGATCTPDGLRNLNVERLDLSCKPGILEYLNLTRVAQKANIIDVDFATPSLVKKIYRLNWNKDIPSTYQGTCSVRNPVLNQNSCSVWETCVCERNSENKCVVKIAPSGKESACKCTESHTYEPPHHTLPRHERDYNYICTGAFV